MKNRDFIFSDAVKTASESKATLLIQGGGSKNHLRQINSSHTVLSTTEHTGIINYEPTELVMTVRSGTPLLEVLDALKKNKQMLSFEPPILSDTATIGGSITTGFCGPNRPWGGSVSDSLLGIKLINGLGEILQFGGQVFKNVAGFDLFRLQAGAWGQLGILSEMSLRLNPIPTTQVYKQCLMPIEQAHAQMLEWQQKPYPISGLVWVNNALHLRLYGRKSAIDDCLTKMNILDWEESSPELFYQIRDFEFPSMKQQENDSLYRISAAAATEIRVELDEQLILDWGGSVRWLRTKAPAEEVFAYATSIGGYAQRWSSPIYQQPLPNELQLINERLKNAFDPHNVFSSSLFNQ